MARGRLVDLRKSPIDSAFVLRLSGSNWPFLLRECVNLTCI